MTIDLQDVLMTNDHHDRTGLSDKSRGGAILFRHNNQLQGSHVQRGKRRPKSYESTPIAQPSIARTAAEIGGVGLMGIGLTLEGDGEVRTKGVTQTHETHEPLGEIDKVERQDKELKHLTRMDALMPKVGISEQHTLPDKDKPEEIDGREATERNKAVDDLHTLLIC